MTSYLFITGAVGGLGSALVHECARRGYNLYLSDLKPDGKDFAKQIAAAYAVQVRYAPCELTSRESRSQLIQSFQDEAIQFCGLINVAGRDFEGAFLERDREQVLHLIALIIEANVDLTHAILKLRDPDCHFLLINVGSLAGFFPMPYKALYASSKRFLIEFSLALREEIKDFGSVMILCPAGLPTHAESRRKIEAQGLLGKLTTLPTEVVAQRTIERALKGQAVYIPGVINQIAVALGGLLPTAAVVGLIGKRWRKVQRQVFPPSPKEN